MGTFTRIWHKIDNPIFWTIMSVIVVCLLIFLFFAIGLMIGYGTIGGGDAGDVFKWETWQRIIDFIK